MKNESVHWKIKSVQVWPHASRRRVLAMVVGAACVFAPATRAELPRHNVIAANINVVQNDTGNATTSVTVTTNYAIGDFRIRDGSNKGDFNVQIGDDATDDGTGLLLTSVRENGRENAGEAGTLTGLVYSVSMTQPGTAGYFIPMNTANGGFAAGGNPEWNANVAAAWFPSNTWLVGYAFNLAGANGSATATNDTLIGSPQLVYGIHYLDRGSGGGANAGKSIVDLTSLGIDSRTDGILIVNGAKNESSNYALSQPNTNNGTWNVILRDTGNTGANGEQDPVAFAFIPKTNTTVISGRFLGDATIAMYSGVSPQFTVTQLSVGTYELKIPGRSPTNGVLIISPEGGGAINFDNIVNYQVNAAGDGWIIESRDTPGSAAAPTPPLESPGPTEGVATFVYLPGPTPGFSVIPTNNLLTTESGGTASFTVALHTPPASDVTIAVSSTNPAEGTVSTNLLTFTPADWSIPQTVTITGQDDAVADGSVAYNVILAPAVSTDLSYNGRNPDDVSVVNADNEGGITVAPTSGLITTEAGGQATFTIRLNTQPGTNVTIALSSSDTTEGTVSPASVTFTTNNWNQDQTVTVTGVDDFVDDGNVGYTIFTAAAASADPSYNGRNAADVSVSNTDNDTTGVTVSAAGPVGLAVAEGRTNGYTVVLSSEPASNVVVNVSSSNTSQGGTIAPATLTFTPANWSNAQPVTVTGADDLVPDGSTSWTITNTISSGDPLYGALAPVLVSMTTLDNEAVITLPSGDLIYGIGLASIGIDGRATIADTNTANYNGGTLTVTLTANGTADDRLEIRNTGNSAGQIGVSANTVSYGGTAIGTFAGGSGTTPLVVTFNNSATPAAGEALLRNVTFRNVNGSPSLNRRSVSVALVHGDGGTSSATTGVRVGLLRAASFQEGADYGYGTYSGEADTQLRQADPNTPYPSGNPTGLFIDWPDAGVQNAFHVLLRFENIFGNGPGQVPTNAVIVAADLFLNATDTGDASPLYRMLMPWDATNETWTSIGNGVDQDDIESRSTYDSAFGLSNGDASTTVGIINFSVMPDIQVWQSGTANYGWVMPGWIGNTDGTGFSPGEAGNISDRPRLRVLWLPAGTPSVSFRQNVNGYTNAVDTRIRQTTPDSEYSTITGVFVDWAVTGSTNNDEQVLLRFDNIIGSDTNQVPAGATIHAAILDLGSTIGNAMGDGGTFHAMLQQWQDTNTWNSLVNGVTADDIEAVAASTAVAGNATLNPNVQAGFLSFELTPDVQAWVKGIRPNYGWVILPWPNGSDGWGFATAEAATERDRPQLRVFYTPGVPSIVIQSITRTPTSATIKFSGVVGNAYTVLRAGTVGGTYGSVGTATVQPDGTATFTDNAPLAGAAFYRISYP
jgi:hypothetical protein